MHRITNVNTMAIGNALSGKIRGKLGSNVFRIEGGKQIISEYNPEKQDRKSDSQLKQRAIMTTATQVSKVFPWECLVGYSVNRSTARREFVRAICKNVQTEQVNNEWRATYDMGVAKFSDKPDVLYSAKTINVVSPENSQVVSCTVTFPESVGVKRFQMIVAFCPNENTTPNLALTALSSEVDANGRATATVQLSNVAQLTSGICYVYAVPVVPNTLKKLTRYSELVHTNILNVMASSVYVEFARADMLMGSIYVGMHNFA